MLRISTLMFTLLVSQPVFASSLAPINEEPAHKCSSEEAQVLLLNTQQKRLIADNVATRVLLQFDVEHANFDIKNIRTLQLNEGVWECNADVYQGMHMMDNGKPLLGMLWSETSSVHYKLEVTDNGQLYLTVIDEQHHGNDPVRE